MYIKRIYMEFRKMVLMNLFAQQQWRCRHREQTHGHSGGGEGGTNWESNIETCTLPCVKSTASGNLLWRREVKPGAPWQRRGAGCAGRWEEGLREGTYIYLWLIHIDIWQKAIQCCKAIILQLKINKIFKK